MSESTRDLAATAPAVAAPRPPVPDTALFASLAAPLAEWLPRRRWFAGKGRPIADLQPVSATELLPYGPDSPAPGMLHLLVQVRQPGLVEDCYQLLLGIRHTLPPRLSPALIGSPDEGPLRGRAVYDALQDPRLAAVLLERLRLPGRLGPLRFTQDAGAAIPPPSSLPSRILDAEQSNSSVVFGSALILKVFRRVYPGVNPDLELPLALAHGGRVPAPAAWYETTAVADADDGPATLGVLTPFLAGSTDGWQLALDHLARGEDFTAEARALGRTTAEVHTALAEELPTTVLRRPQTEHLAAAMTERLEHTAAAVPALQPYRDALGAAFADLAALGRRGQAWAAQRIHGDLHLGQVLRTADGWQVIDFEGEPARPLAERRRAEPAARDIAGMLRSFDYAARTGAADPLWARRNCDAFCAGYADAAGTDPRAEPELLRAYETDKAVYEVLYEARHRPDWLDVPMAAIRRLAGTRA